MNVFFCSLIYRVISDITSKKLVHILHLGRINDSSPYFLSLELDIEICVREAKRMSSSTPPSICRRLYERRKKERDLHSINPFDVLFDDIADNDALKVIVCEMKFSVLKVFDSLNNYKRLFQ